MKPPFSRLVALSSLPLTCIGCTDPQEIEVNQTDTSVDLGFRFRSLYTNLRILDYMGQYSLRATAVTAFNDPPTTRLTGEARDIQKDTYSPIDEYGSIELLRLSQIEGEEHNGRPVFDFAQRLDFSEVNCQIEMNGEIKESIPPEEANSDAPYYKYYGPAYIDCPGLSLEFIANTLYDTPGELVGMVDGVFHIEDTSSE